MGCMWFQDFYVGWIRGYDSLGWDFVIPPPPPPRTAFWATWVTIFLKFHQFHGVQNLFGINFCDEIGIWGASFAHGPQVMTMKIIQHHLWENRNLNFLVDGPESLVSSESGPCWETATCVRVWVPTMTYSFFRSQWQFHWLSQPSVLCYTHLF